MALKISASADVVYLVQHSYQLNDGEDEVKTIGVFRSRSAAQRAVNAAKRAPGFKRYPDGFFIDQYALNQR